MLQVELRSLEEELHFESEARAMEEEYAQDLEHRLCESNAKIKAKVEEERVAVGQTRLQRVTLSQRTKNNLRPTADDNLHIRNGG